MTIDEHTFKTVEQYSQYMKAIHHDLQEIACKMLKADDPVVAMKSTTHTTGRTQTMQEKVMQVGLEAKLGRHKHLAKCLVDTGDHALVAADPRDAYWAAGTTIKNLKKNLAAMTGQNRLGALLTEVRNKLTG